MHIHDVDYIRYLLGEPNKIQSVGQRGQDGQLQQIFTSYVYDHAIATAEACWDYPTNFPFSMSYRVKFEKATVVFDSAVTPALQVYPQNGEPFSPEIVPEYAGDNQAGGNLSSLGAYYNELKYFVQHLQSGEPIAINTLDEAVKSALLTLQEIDLCGGAQI